MKKKFVIHPFLFALFPILFLFSHNIKEMSFSETFRPTAMVVSFTILLWLLLSLVIRNIRKAGIIASIFLLLFFSYGHLRGFISHILRNIAYFHFLLFEKFPLLSLLSPDVKEMPFNVIVLSTATIVCFTLLLWILVNAFVRRRRKSAIITIILLLAIFCYGHLMNFVLDILFYLHSRETHFVLLLALIFMGSTFLVIKTHRKLHNFTNYLNIVSIFLVTFPVINIVFHKCSWKTRTLPEIEAAGVDSEKSGKYPNIYYIIPDAYAREDVLEELYQYDNSEFLKYLVQKDFFIASKSTSNYAQSILSLASSLNVIYLDDLAEQVGPDFDSRHPLTKMIRNNRVFHFLKQYGYVTIAFDASAWEPVQIKSADIFYTPPGFSLSAFDNALINTTPVPFLLRKSTGLLREDSITLYNFHRRKILYAFDKLGDICEQKGPLFVFVHILAPHQPFVFGEDGESIISGERYFDLWDTGGTGIYREEYIQGYKRQLTFVNKKLMETIDKILSNSPEPPIIILQADHGPASMLDCENIDSANLKERMSILNAYYLPGSGDKKLYDGITPVNTFRIIFNHYFGTNLELLEDKCYYSTWTSPYKFIDVTDRTNTD